MLVLMFSANAWMGFAFWSQQTTQWYNQTPQISLQVFKGKVFLCTAMVGRSVHLWPIINKKADKSPGSSSSSHSIIHSHSPTQVAEKSFHTLSSFVSQQRQHNAGSLKAINNQSCLGPTWDGVLWWRSSSLQFWSNWQNAKTKILQPQCYGFCLGFAHSDNWTDCLEKVGRAPLHCIC